MTISALPVPTTHPRIGSRRHHSFGFWVTAAAFLVNMGFSAVPTPLYALYQRRDQLSTVTVTLVYAVYAAGVIGSLLMAGHASDWVGRKRVLVAALLTSVVAAAIFLTAPGLAGLLLARVVSGVSIGLTTATATAYLSELHVATAAGVRGGRRGELVAAAANLGGIGVGPLVAGLLAQYAPQPLRLPYLVFGALLLGLALLVGLAPETAVRPESSRAWRPQKIAVPAHARRTFFAAVAAGIASFAVYGVFNSLVPSFLVGTLKVTSHAAAGGVAFAAFASGALAQVAMSRASLSGTVRTGPLLLIPGLGLLVVGMSMPSLAVFVLGGVVAGAGGGLVFRAALAVAASTAPDGARAEVLAGYFLGAYVGLSLPVVALGIATQYAAPRDAMLVFVGLVSIAVMLSARALLAAPGDHHHPARKATSR